MHWQCYASLFRASLSSVVRVLFVQDSSLVTSIDKLRFVSGPSLLIRLLDKLTEVAFPQSPSGKFMRDNNTA